MAKDKNANLRSSAISELIKRHREEYELLYELEFTKAGRPRRKMEIVEVPLRSVALVEADLAKVVKKGSGR